MTWQDIVLPLAHWPPTHQSCAALAMLPQVSLYVESPIRPRFIFQWHLQKNKHSLFTIGALRSAYVTSPVLWEVWFQIVPKTCVAITIPGIWWHISSGTQGHYNSIFNNYQLLVYLIAERIDNFSLFSLFSFWMKIGLVRFSLKKHFKHYFWLRKQPQKVVMYCTMFFS